LCEVSLVRLIAKSFLPMQAGMVCIDDKIFFPHRRQFFLPCYFADQTQIYLEESRLANQ
jgi:hypothetical protein